MTHRDERYDIYEEDGVVLLFKDIVRYILMSVLPFRTCWLIHQTIRPRIHPFLYDAPAEPWKRINIDPHEVEYCAGGFRISHLWGLSQVERGNWDRRGRPFEENTTYHSLHQRFVQGLDWKDTDYIDNYDLNSGYDNNPEEFIDVRCEYVDFIYEDITENGYVPNEEGTNQKAPRRVESYQNVEYLVAIGRNGEFLHVDGAHRISIAKILDLDEIPVMIAGRHKEWQEIRDEIHNASNYCELSGKAKSCLTHPDLTDVLSENDDLDAVEEVT